MATDSASGAYPRGADDRFDAFFVAGVRIDAAPLDPTVERMVEHRGGAVHLCNAYTVSLASRSTEFRELLNAGRLNLPDGMPLVWIARRLGLDLTERTYGPELMARMFERGRDVELRHYLYGSTPEVLDGLCAQIARRWPGTTIAGVESPPFTDLGDDELRSAVERMTAVRTDIVWVGLGTPKQDVVVQRLAELGSQTFVAVGAAFDFLAGAKKQAPRWMQRHGLEWLFRLATEPRRLWKRYLVGNTSFVWAVTLGRLPTTRLPASGGNINAITDIARPEPRHPARRSRS